MKTTKTNVNKLDQNYLEAENLANKFIYFEDLEANPELLEQMIEQAKKDIKEGKYKTFEQFTTEMEAKYHINE